MTQHDDDQTAGPPTPGILVTIDDAHAALERLGDGTTAADLLRAIVLAGRDARVMIEPPMPPMRQYASLAEFAGALDDEDGPLVPDTDMGGYFAELAAARAARVVVPIRAGLDSCTARGEDPREVERLWPGRVAFLEGKDGMWIVDHRWAVCEDYDGRWVAIDLPAGGTVEHNSVGEPAATLGGKIAELIGPVQPALEDDPVAKALGIVRCCGGHGVTCEPPSELCCRHCTERNHPDHPNVDCVLKSGGQR